MKNNRMQPIIFFVLCLMLILGIKANAFAVEPPFTEIIPNEFEDYYDTENLATSLDWFDYADESSSGSTELGFSVSLGGASYDYFNINSNGYVQLMQNDSDPTNDYGYGYIDELLSEDPSSTYLLAAYDDLSSYSYGYYGYKLFSDRAVFLYDTETYADEDMDYTNRFEMILHNNGNVQWNFSNASYDSYDYELFSGIYLGNTETLHELAIDMIPTEKSYLYPAVAPEPVSSTLFIIGGATLGFRRFRNKFKQ